MRIPETRQIDVRDQDGIGVIAEIWLQDVIPGAQHQSHRHEQRQTDRELLRDQRTAQERRGLSAAARRVVCSAGESGPKRLERGVNPAVHPATTARPHV